MRAKSRAVLLAVVVVLLGTTASTVSAGPPQLNVQMDVDQQKAVRGDVLDYVVEVRNLSHDTALHIEMESHIPEDTTGVTDQCPEGPIEDDGDICIAPAVPTPGLGEDVHQVRMGFGSLEPGQTAVFRFSVRIDADAVIGSKIRNHAHAIVDNSSESSNQVSTMVVAS